MATPSIGAIEFMTLSGRVTTVGTVLVETTPDDENGHEYMALGTRAPESMLMTELDVTSDAGITTHIAACKALQGTLVTVTDPHGEDIDNVAVLDVQVDGSKRTGTAVGGINGGNRIVTLRWRVQATE